MNDDRFYDHVVRYGSLGFGESYVDKWIEIPRVDETVSRFLNSPESNNYNSKLPIILFYLSSMLQNKQSKKRADIVGRLHYDLGNDLFQCMLDKRLTYSCGYWKNATNLDEAQEAKLDLICRKLYLKPGMRILDIGCGWGSFAKFAAEKVWGQRSRDHRFRKTARPGQKLCVGLPMRGFKIIETLKMRPLIGLFRWGRIGACRLQKLPDLYENCGRVSYRRWAILTPYDRGTIFRSKMGILGSIINLPNGCFRRLSSSRRPVKGSL